MRGCGLVVSSLTSRSRILGNLNPFEPVMRMTNNHQCQVVFAPGLLSWNQLGDMEGGVRGVCSTPLSPHTLALLYSGEYAKATFLWSPCSCMRIADLLHMSYWKKSKLVDGGLMLQYAVFIYHTYTHSSPVCKEHGILRICKVVLRWAPGTITQFRFEFNLSSQPWTN